MDIGICSKGIQPKRGWGLTDSSDKRNLRSGDVGVGVEEGRISKRRGSSTDIPEKTGSFLQTSLTPDTSRRVVQPSTSLAKVDISSILRFQPPRAFLLFTNIIINHLDFLANN